MSKKKSEGTEKTEIDEVLNEEEESLESTESELGEQKAKEGEAEPSKVKIGEKKYTSDELAKLVEKAEQVSSIEKEQNIDIGKLYPDYTRKSQLLSDPVKLGAYIAEKFGTEKVLSSEEKLKREAIEEAKKVYGIVTREDLEEFKKSFAEELEVNQLMSDVSEIEKESGISRTDLLDFMKVTKETDPYKASEKILGYQKMNGSNKEPSKPTFTEKSGSSGTHVPAGKKVPSIDDTEGVKKVIEDMLSTPGPEAE